jgi:hypothetical protein
VEVTHSRFARLDCNQGQITEFCPLLISGSVWLGSVSCFFLNETSGRSNKIYILIDAEMLLLSKLPNCFGRGVANLLIEGVHLSERRWALTFQGFNIAFEILRL